MEPICVVIFCLGLVALCGCGRASKKAETEGPEKNGENAGTARGRETAEMVRSQGAAGMVPGREDSGTFSGGTVPAGADLKPLFDAAAGTGSTPLEFDYGDESRIVFHGSFGLFVCGRQNTGWQVLRSLDLKALGADAMEGDDYAVIDAGRERAYITPAYFATDNENPVTYCFDYENNILRERWEYQSVRNELLSWSYGQSMPVQEEADRLLGSRNLVRSSNIYPVRGIGGGEYGFLASENGLLKSLSYCIYREKGDELVCCPLFSGNDHREKGCS